MKSSCTSPLSLMKLTSWLLWTIARLPLRTGQLWTTFYILTQMRLRSLFLLLTAPMVAEGVLGPQLYNQISEISVFFFVSSLTSIVYLFVFWFKKHCQNQICLIKIWTRDDHSCFYVRLLQFPFHQQVISEPSINGPERCCKAVNPSHPSCHCYIGCLFGSGFILSFWFSYTEPCMVRHLCTSPTCSTLISTLGHRDLLTRPYKLFLVPVLL